MTGPKSALAMLDTVNAKLGVRKLTHRFEIGSCLSSDIQWLLERLREKPLVKAGARRPESMKV